MKIIQEKAPNLFKGYNKKAINELDTEKISVLFKKGANFDIDFFVHILNHLIEDERIYHLKISKIKGITSHVKQAMNNSQKKNNSYFKNYWI